MARYFGGSFWRIYFGGSFWLIYLAGFHSKETSKLQSKGKKRKENVQLVDL
jgi:hypothetical protein